MNKLVAMGLLLCVCVVGVSQDYHYSIRDYTAVDGLPQSQVVTMVEDKNGYLWLGTLGGGLARFDGREFKVYSTLDGMLSNEVRRLLFDRDNNLWILHPRGVSRFDGLHFKTFARPDADTYLRDIFLYRDSIFLLTSKGLLASISNDSIQNSSLLLEGEQKISWVYRGRKNDVYFLMNDNSLRFHHNNSQDTISLEETGKIFSFFNYKKQVIVQCEEGFFAYDTIKKVLNKFDLGFSSKNTVIQYDERNDVFWTSNEMNLFKEKFAKGKLTIDTILHEVGIHKVLIDSEENTWFGSDGHGLYKYFIQDFDRCSSDKIQGVMAIHKDADGNRWLGTFTKGLLRMKDGEVHSYFDKDRPYRNLVQTIKQSPQGDLWIGTGNGMGKYNTKKDSFDWITFEDGLPGYSVSCIDFDENNGLWAGTGKGLGYYSGKNMTPYTAKNGLSNPMIRAIKYFKKYKTLFIGSDFGIQKFENKTFSTIPIKGLASTSIFSISTYKDSLVIFGTGGAGIFFLNPITNNSTSFSTRDGLMSDFIYFVSSDEKNYIWIGSEKGINRIKLNSRLEIIENLHFGYDNGLIGVETNQNAYYLSPTEKYFGLVDGVYQFNDVKRDGKNSFDLHLTDIEILYGEYSARDYADSTYGFFKIPYHLSVPPDKNHLTFHFSRVDKRHPKSIKFKYWLENFDKAWSPASSTGLATYSNLPPGDYVFHVMTTNNQGSWSKSEIAYPFSVKAPFYLRASFIVGMMLLLSGLITLIMYVRVRQRIKNAVQFERMRTKEQEYLRKEIARDFHDEMGNQLTRIINYVSLLKLNGQSGYDHHELYNKVENSAKYLYSGTRDFIWAIDPVNDELSKLFIYIRDFGVKIFEEKSIMFRAFNDIKETIKLPYGFSREANFIFKEVMTNAFKYSEAKNVTLSLSNVDDTFFFNLEDDGVGFYVGDIEKSNGLKNIRERADKINAILRISSEPGKGTKISLNFKLTKSLKYGTAL